MRVLVTGGAGYIGSVVAQRLLNRGDEVSVLDSLSRGHRAAVPAGARFMEVDLLDSDATRDALAQGFDAVMHFAALALVAESVEFPERYYRGNVVASLNLLDAMRAAWVRRLVFSSTCATYGEPERIPIDEAESCLPVNSYGSSKLTVDRMIGDEARAHGLAAISLDGTAVRDYVHVADLARAHELALDRTRAGRHEVINLGSGTGYSVREVVDTARAVTGREIVVEERPRRPGDPPRLVAGTEKAHRLLGWCPTRSLDAMISDAWAWHEAHPQGYASGSEPDR